MKKTSLASIALIAAALGLSACSTYSPDPGYETVIVSKPMFFGHGGVEDESVKTGRSYDALTTEGIDVYMQPKRYEVDMPDTMTSDGVPITFHAVMTVQVTDSVDLIKKFGANWYTNNLEMPFQSMIRKAVRKHGMNDTVTNPVTLDAIDQEIHDNMVSFIQVQKLPVSLITMTVGRAIPPDAIKTQRIETAAQEQRINTERQTKLAEDARGAAEASRATADNAYRQAMGLSPEQFVQLERLKMLATVCGTPAVTKGREREASNCTFIEGGSVVPTLAIK